MRKHRLLSLSVFIVVISLLGSLILSGCSGSEQNNVAADSEVKSFSVEKSDEDITASAPASNTGSRLAAIAASSGSTKSANNSAEPLNTKAAETESVDNAIEDPGDQDYVADDSEDDSYYEEPEYESDENESAGYYEEPDTYVEDDYEEDYEDDYEEDTYEEEYYEEDTYTEYVWLSATGSKYHNKNNCGNMNPNKAYQVTLEEAQAQGYDACKKCF